MELSLGVILSMATKLMVNFHGLIAILTKESLSTINFKGRANLYGMIRDHMKDIGKII